ncbi:conjugal transfer protein TraG N-terminal domain-containing protein [Ottowia sp.]|uniref:conjugal transfer protein TraG N-terminal domain-containing protein n=1 Tax=Ottowia sp. TaxID=1898956 RepID=UPI0025E45F5D|nr:conjugal transfer protein TraG N-terminal domain-containing protein [Ottowia sp.]
MWEIYAYQNADSLFGIFNAAATIHGSGDYMAAVAAVAFCGFIAALVAYAFAPEKLQGWKWLATVLLVFSVLIVPRVTVGVVDKTGGSAVKVVANVPFGVAFLGSVTSTVGHTLTGLFETAFQVIPGVGALPSELSYEKNGLMFGNRLIRETGGVAFQDPNFRTDLVNFIHNCTMYDLIDGTVDPGTFSSSDDVWALMASPNPARFTTLTSAGGSITVDTCPNAYTNLNGRLPAQLTRIQGKLAFQLNPTLPAAAANAAIAGQIQQAYLKNSIATAAATAADLIRQNAVLNAINDTSNIIGQKVNDPAAMVLAVGRAQSVAQQNAAWLNAGKVAEQALPVFRNVIEAITYALFPLLVLLMLLTSGRETMLAFKGYAAVLIWIQLWPPLYAVLNYMASIYAAYDLAAAADLGSGAKGSVAADGIDDLLPGDLRRGRGRLPGDQHPVHRLGRAQADGDLWHRAGGRSLGPAVDGGRRHGRCRRGQSEHGQCLDGPDPARAEPDVRVREQLAERHQRQHLLVKHADRPDRRQPAAQPGLRVPGRLDARERAGRAGRQPSGRRSSHRGRCRKLRTFDGALRGVHQGLGKAEVIAEQHGIDIQPACAAKT